MRKIEKSYDSREEFYIHGVLWNLEKLAAIMQDGKSVVEYSSISGFKASMASRLDVHPDYVSMPKVLQTIQYMIDHGLMTAKEVATSETTHRTMWVVQQRQEIQK